jgi:Dolichyl-phosphate-mannose-protein mannosyltransferase
VPTDLEVMGPSKAPAVRIAASLAIFLIAAAVRVAFLLSLSGTQGLTTPDTPAYEDLAFHIQRGERYQTSRPGGPGGFPADLQRPPGYPFFLAMIERTGEVDRYRVAVVQIVMTAFLATGLAWLAIGLWGFESGVFAGLFYALDWTAIVHAAPVMADTLYTVVLTTALAAFIGHLRSGALRWAFVAGALMGMACLVKPAAQIVLPAFFFAWLLSRRRSLLGGLLFATALLLCLTPWLWRNFRTHGVFKISDVSPVAARFYLAEGIVGGSGNDPERIGERVNELDALWSARVLSPVEREKLMMKEASVLVSQHCGQVLKQAVVGFVRTAVGTSRQTVVVMRGRGDLPDLLRHTVLPLCQVLCYWILAGMSSVMLLRQREYALATLLTGVLFLVIVPAASPIGYSRYRVPASPTLCLLAGASLRGLRARAGDESGTPMAPRESRVVVRQSAVASVCPSLSALALLVAASECCC